MIQPERDKMIQLLKDRSKRGSDFREILMRQKEFSDAFNTPIGFELLKDLLAKGEELLKKISEDTATADEKKEYKIVKDMTLLWAKRIDAYQKNIITLNTKII